MKSYIFKNYLKLKEIFQNLFCIYLGTIFAKYSCEMNSNFQCTIKRDIIINGKGLHTGKDVTLKLTPAPAGTGIIFKRKRNGNSYIIEANWKNILGGQYATVIGKDGATISTVEHLIAALFGLGIDNILIEIDGPEVPIMDGSAEPFVQLIKETGFKYYRQKRKFINVKRTLRIKEGDSEIVLLPSQEFGITYTIDFPHEAISTQTFNYMHGDGAFEREIASARTFGFVKDIIMLQAKGLALGGSLDCAIVIDERGIINKEMMRFEDEFVRHKVLDAVGDLGLAGYPIKGHLIAYKSGHWLNHKIIRKLFTTSGAYDIVEE